MKKEIILPPICPKDEHDWRKGGAHACGNCSGDQATDESIVLTDPVIEPEPGCFCNKCFQLYGQPQGVRSSSIVAAFEALSAW